MILRESGDFDMENIRYLTLGGRLVRDVSVVGACLNLVELNLSANLIADATSLGKLTCLQVLDLRSNRISNIGSSLLLLQQQWFYFCYKLVRF